MRPRGEFLFPRWGFQIFHVEMYSHLMRVRKNGSEEHENTFK